MSRYPILILTFLALAAVRALNAQEPDRAQGFLSLRLASETSHTLFGGIDVGSFTLVTGMVQNPRTEYREVVGGVGRAMGGGRTMATLALAGAHASDGWYAQLYLLPAISWGDLSVSGVAVFYEPMESRGARQFYLNPLTLSFPVGRHVLVGIANMLAIQEGAETINTLGPMLQVMIGPTRTLSVTALDGARARGELRLDAGVRF
jgi:hypothetical protein